jgi:hypothetical protein
MNLGEVVGEGGEVGEFGRDKPLWKAALRAVEATRVQGKRTVTFSILPANGFGPA